MLARATSSASALTSVAHTTTSGSSASSASAIAPEPVPRSATAADGSASTSDESRRRDAPQPAPLGLLERDLDDLLGLRSRDQHAPVDHAGRGRGTTTSRARTAAARPPTRRSTSGRRRAYGARRAAAASAIVGHSAARVARHLLDEKRASTSAVTMPARREPADDLAARRAPGSRQLRAHAAVVTPAELTPAFVGRERVDDLVELAVEHAVERVHREPDAVIGDAVLLVVVRADLLGAAAALHLLAARRAHLGVLLVLLGLQQPRAQDAHRLVLVLQLALLVLARRRRARSACA